ncbi:MAG: endonuclease/exonuclease/phosphatase family protein [Anaerolineae bacterium]|jgi:endonuclease/exonuclease/phosphatase family metal-dependent hydrolase|nr:endonuclease/exonuclease/phosphatase family protein [Anaerolineae bacterium]
MHRPKARTWVFLGVGLALVAVAAFLLNVSRPGPLTPIGAPAGGPIPATVTVATLNLWHDHPHYSRQAERLQAAISALRALSPDLVCLQEASRTPMVPHAAGQLADALGMAGAYARANGNRALIRFEEGEAVLARAGLTGEAWRELSPRAGLFEHRVAVWGTVGTEAGPVVVFSTHITNKPGEVNNAQICSLVELVERERRGLPAVVAGDFNAHEDTPQIRGLPAHWHDAFREAKPDAPGATSLDSGKRIDYIFLVDGDGVRWQVLDADTFGDEAISDHRGVWARARLVPHP